MTFLEGEKNEREKKVDNKEIFVVHKNVFVLYGQECKIKYEYKVTVCICINVDTHAGMYY